MVPVEVRGKKKKGKGSNTIQNIGNQAVDKQLEIMEEQQQKAGEFVDKKV